MNFDKKETLALYVKNYSGVFDIMSSTVIILVIVMLTIADISFSFYILEILCVFYIDYLIQTINGSTVFPVLRKENHA